MWRVLIVSAVLLSGCGRSGVAPPDPVPEPEPVPAVSISFPPGGSLTDQDTLVVDGTAAHVAAVFVNGVAATSDDGFRTWQAEVPLAIGDNELLVEAEGAGETSVRIERQEPFFAVPRGITLDPATSTVWLADQVFFYGRIDLTTETRYRYDPSIGWDGVYGIAVDHGRGQVYITGERGCHRLNLSNRNRSSVPPVGSPWRPRGVYWDETRQRLLFADGYRETLYGVERANWAAARYTALDGLLKEAFAFDEAENRVYAMAETIHMLDLDTNELVPISGPALGSGPLIDPAGVRSMTMDAASGILYCAHQDEALVYAIDIATGARRIVSGEGPVLRSPYGIVFDAAGSRLLVSDGVLDGLMAIDVATGERSLVAVPTRGNGPRMRGARDLVCDEDGRALLLNSIHEEGQVLAIDGVDRTHVADFPAIDSPRRFTIGADGDMLATGRPALYRIDLATEAQETVSDTTTGSGDPFDAVVDAVELVNGEAFVLTVDLDTNRFASLWRVDVATGQRSKLSLDSHFRAGMGLDPIRGELLVVSFDHLYVVDPTTGASEVIADIPWPKFRYFPDVAVDAPGRRAFMVGSSFLYRVDLDTRELTAVGNLARVLYWPSAAVYDAARDVVLVADRRLNALFAVSPATGAAVIISR